MKCDKKRRAEILAEVYKNVKAKLEHPSTMKVPPLEERSSHIKKVKEADDYRYKIKIYVGSQTNLGDMFRSDIYGIAHYDDKRKIVWDELMEVGIFKR